MSYAILTWCHILQSQGIITLCHTLLLHGELTSCCTLLSHDVLTLCHTLLSYAMLYIMPYSTVTCQTFIVPHSTLSCCTYIVSYATVTCCTYIVPYSNDINNFIILFEHKEIHKLTWISPNQRDKNQIDHLLISGKWRRSLQDVQFRSGVDVGRDHHLVVAHIKVKLKRTVIPIRLLKRFVVSKLKDAGISPIMQY